MKKLNMSCDYSLSSSWKGKSWKDWLSKLNIENLLKEKDKKHHHHARKHSGESVRTLPRKDILLHGQYPKEDISELCSCEKCGKVMMVQSYLYHMQTRHGPGHGHGHGHPNSSENSKLSSELKKKNKPSKSKRKSSSITSSTPNASSFLEQNALTDSSSSSSTINKSKTSENSSSSSDSSKKSSSSKQSCCSNMYSMNKKRSKSKSDDHMTLKNLDDKKSRDSMNCIGKDALFKILLSDYKSSKDCDNIINNRSSDHVQNSDEKELRDKSSHNSKLDKRSSYCCEKCGKVFENQELLSSHQKYKHSSSSSNISKHMSHNSNSKSSSNKKKNMSNSKSISSSSNSSSNTKKSDRTSGTKPYTELVSDLSSLINHKGKSWTDMSKLLDNNKHDLKYKDAMDYDSVRALPRIEIKLFGSFPKMDSRILTACEKCAQVVIAHEIENHQKFRHNPENCSTQIGSSNNLSPNSVKKKNAHIKNKKKSLLISSSATTPVVSPKSAPSSPPSPLQASNEVSLPIMQLVQTNKVSSSSVTYNNTTSTSSPTTPPSSPSRHKKIKKDNKYKTTSDVNNYYDPDKHLNALTSSKSVCLRSVKTNENAKRATSPPVHSHSKGSNSSSASFESNHRSSPPVQVVKPFLPQLQSPQQTSHSVSSSSLLMPPPPPPPPPSSSKHKKLKKNSKKPKEAETDSPKHLENSESSKGPCLRPVRGNNIIRVQQRRSVSSKNKNSGKITVNNKPPPIPAPPPPPPPKEKEVAPPAVPKVAPGLSVPKLLDDDVDLPISTTTSQHTSVTSHITSTKFVTPTFVKIAPACQSSEFTLPSMPTIFTPTFTTSLNSTMTSSLPVTLTTTLETALPPTLSPTLAAVPTINTIIPSVELSMPTLQPVLQKTAPQPSVPSILDPIIQTFPIQNEVQTIPQYQPVPQPTSIVQSTVQNTILTQNPASFPVTLEPVIQPIETTLQANVRSPTIQTTLQPTQQSTILTTLPSTIQPSVSPAVQPNMQPMQLAISPASLTPNETFISTISPSQLVLLPMSPVSVVSPIQEKPDTTVAQKYFTPKSIHERNSHSLPRKANTNMVSILRKNTETANLPSEKAADRFVQFGRPVIRMASQPFLNPEPIFLTVPVPNTNSSMYTPHPKPLTSAFINGGILKRHGVSVSPHRAGGRVEFLRNEIQQVTIARRPIGNSCPLLNIHHHRPNILKQPKNNLRTTGVKRSATEKLGNDSKQIRLSTDVNGFILHTDVSEAAEAPQPTNSVTFLNLK